jgi:CDP-glucose 4,6-dehydratase
MFHLTGVESLLASHTIGDIGDYASVIECVSRVQPRAIIHLAAQPLVLQSYREPVETFRTNAMGTVHVLEAARFTPSVAGVIAITTDKVYVNDDDGIPFSETAPLGGYDPYAASKAAAEMALMGYRGSLTSWQRKLVIECARGGNIIGGGDWSDNRLIPDYARAIATGTALTIRNPKATRPWQHVLSLVHGYALLLKRVVEGTSTLYGEAWNFGPSHSDCISVELLMRKLAETWQPVSLQIEPSKVHEATRLSIDSTKAHRDLHWHPALSLDGAIAATALWYQTAAISPDHLAELTKSQIAAYFENL